MSEDQGQKHPPEFTAGVRVYLKRGGEGIEIETITEQLTVERHATQSDLRAIAAELWHFCASQSVHDIGQARFEAIQQQRRVQAALGQSVIQRPGGFD